MPFPKIMKVYVNTTPYSMDDYEKKCISISYERNENFITSFIHEANHYMFRRKYQGVCEREGFNKKETEDIKEIITILNNDFFQKIMKAPDEGWKKHKELRQKFQSMYRKSENVDWAILNLLRLLKNNRDLIR